MFCESAGCEDGQIGRCLTFEGGTECHKEDTERTLVILPDKTAEKDSQVKTQKIHVFNHCRNRDSMADEAID